ncbi:MFS transporter [Corticibacterium sp. UT-5YL-CI-8]|nr:MFS transporter [Tianweitania sp. UT-5YL-CI-8]
MTQPSATHPISDNLGPEVRDGHIGSHGSIAPGEIAVGVFIGRTSEFFDFFVYAIASVVVFPRLVFPYVDALTGTLYSFGIFALAFVVRPVGTAIFMAVDRAYGKGAKMIGALLLLGTATVAVAFLPGYERIGIAAVWLLAIARMLQGIALGGTWDGLASLLALYAPKEKRGWYAMIPQLGAPAGLIVASALFAFFVGNLSAQDFFDWGWRYPFFVAFAINVVALFARLRMVSTPEYAEMFANRELMPMRVFETFRMEGRTVIIGAFAPLASFALFHMVTVFPLSWVFLFTSEGIARFLVIETVSAFFGLAAIVASGIIADRVGRRSLLIGTAVAIAAFSGFAPQLLDGGPVGETVFMVLGFILLGLSFGQSSGVVAAGFSKTYRYTGSALTSDLAWLFGAGFAPLAALLLSTEFGLLAAGGYLLSGAICTMLAVWLSARPAVRD